VADFVRDIIIFKGTLASNEAPHRIFRGTDFAGDFVGAVLNFEVSELASIMAHFYKMSTTK
jgi:hypothetical protein